MNFKTLKDEELIFFITLESEEAFKELYDRYYIKSKRIVKDILVSFPNSGVSQESLISVAMESMVNCMKSFDVNKYLFYTYFRASAEHAIKEYLMKNSYTSKKNLVYQTSLDATIDLGDSTVELSEVIGDVDSSLQQNNLYNDIISFIEDEDFPLKGEDKQIFLYYVQGYDVKEIVTLLPKTKKSRIYRVVRIGKEYLIQKFR